MDTKKRLTVNCLVSYLLFISNNIIHSSDTPDDC